MTEITDILRYRNKKKNTFTNLVTSSVEYSSEEFLNGEKSSFDMILRFELKDYNV